jgi:hypothetical protein
MFEASLTKHYSEIEDCTREWTFKSDSTDYIHMRWLMGSIRDWDFLSSEAFRVCRPGGWVESHEASSNIDSDDNTVDGNSAMGQWGKLFIEGSKKIGTSFTVVEDGTQRKALEKAGFINIQEFDFKVKVECVKVESLLIDELESYRWLVFGPDRKGNGPIYQIWS